MTNSKNDTVEGAFDFDPKQLAAPLPRSYHWADGSAYVTHVEMVRKARGAELPESFWTDPLMYMGASDVFLGPCDDVPMESEDWGIDFEAEVAVFTDDVPAGISPEQAKVHIKLITIINDVSLRNLIPAELAKQFGFYQSKPHTSFAPVAVTPDELGDAWDGGKIHLPLHSTMNGIKLGSPNAGVDNTFDLPRLISHAAKSRPLYGRYCRRFRYGFQRRQQGRLILHLRDQVPGDHRQRQADYRIHEIRGSYRD